MRDRRLSAPWLRACRVPARGERPPLRQEPRDGGDDEGEPEACGEMTVERTRPWSARMQRKNRIRPWATGSRSVTGNGLLRVVLPQVRRRGSAAQTKASMARMRVGALRPLPRGATYAHRKLLKQYYELCKHPDAAELRLLASLTERSPGD